ncbi:NUDIX domain-containing protein [Sciscionella marina]|uniref:NUDIX domain-containing protein n=1 Tax=Sciscionella marina TaxID=508770 RepID=UPI00037E754B|nr:NUDIX hydrolase [Sciscionella marina]
MNHVFETVSSEPVYRGNIFALRADEVVMPGGRTARREVVEHYGAAVIVALDEDGAVVLIHQYRHAVGKRLWELPAGLLDVPGESPVQTARRELVEEVGLAAREWRTLVDVAASPGMTDEVARVFLATGLSEVDRPEPSEEEADLRIHRVPLDEALRMAMAGQIINGSAVSGLFAARAVLDGTLPARDAEAEFPDRPTRFAAGRKH